MGLGLSCELIVIEKVRGLNHFALSFSILIGENEVQDFI